jgi:bacteriorhodopsin
MLETRNNALNLNPPNSQEHITTHGSDWYWAVFAVMATSALVFSALAARKPRNSRIFYYITIALLTTASIAYYTMASDLGAAPVNNEFQRSNPLVRGKNRQIFYARYIDW